MVDLGAWANGSYRVPAVAKNEDDDALPAPPEE
jgi:endogenous inhibitor of DNA gyrase (YacG/DUF329 family)